MKKGKVKVLIYVGGAIVLVLILLFVYKVFIQADAITVVVRGTIYEGLNNATSGPPVPGVTVTLINVKNQSFSTQTDKSGNYSINIVNPLQCGYRVIVSKSGYNAKEAGTIPVSTLSSSYNTAGQLAFSNISSASKEKQPRFNYPIDREVDLMWSNYFNGAYPSGYADNFYHFSKWDLFYVKNLTTLDQVINKKAPTAASFEVPIEPLPVLNQKVSNSTMQGPGFAAKSDTVWAMFQVYPVTSNWASNKIMSEEKPVYTLKKKLSEVYADGKVKFDFNYKDIDQSARYQSYINGFQVTTGFYLADANGKPISDPNAGDINPDLRIYRSEDGKMVKVNYTGLESYSPFDCPCQELTRTNIKTTTFGGCDQNKTNKCADYPQDNCLGRGDIKTNCDGPTQYYVSLPYSYVSAQCNGSLDNCKKILVTNTQNNKSIVLAVVDSGPCNTSDKNYVCGPDRPQVEAGNGIGGCSKQKPNYASMDISPTAMQYLGGKDELKLNWVFTSQTKLGPVQ